MTIGERPNKKYVESFDFTRKVNILGFELENVV